MDTHTCRETEGEQSCHIVPRSPGMISNMDAVTSPGSYTCTSHHASPLMPIDSFFPLRCFLHKILWHRKIFMSCVQRAMYCSLSCLSGRLYDYAGRWRPGLLSLSPLLKPHLSLSLLSITLSLPSSLLPGWKHFPKSNSCLITSDCAQLKL